MNWKKKRFDGGIILTLPEHATQKLVMGARMAGGSNPPAHSSASFWIHAGEGNCLIARSAGKASLEARESWDASLD